MLAPAQSPGKELVRSACREWAGAPIGNVRELGQSLCCGWGGVGAAEQTDVIGYVNANNWSSCVNKSAPNYDYDLTLSGFPAHWQNWPMVYGIDSWGITPASGGAGAYCYWPGGAAGGGPAGNPGANSMMWLGPKITSNTQKGILFFNDTAGDGYAQQFFFGFCQASWWVYLPGQLSRTLDPALSGNYLSMTDAYRGRYQLDRYRAGFKAHCELWAAKSDGTFGWETGLGVGYAEGIPPYGIGAMPRYCTLDAVIGVGPNQWREIPIPTATTGSDTLANGFLGLANFEIWGITWAAWQAATGL